MSKDDFKQVNRPASPPIYSIRFSWPQRAELDRLTQGQSWAAYIKGVVFSGKLAHRAKKGSYDYKTLAKLLAALGKSRIASNINQLARAANSGSLPVNEDVVKALMEATRAIEWMKRTLIKGMRIKPPEPEVAKDHSHDPHR